MDESPKDLGSDDPWGFAAPTSRPSSKPAFDVDQLGAVNEATFSESRGQRLENVEEVLKVGDKVQVEIKEVDPRGKLSLIPVIEGGDAEAAEGE